MLQRECNGVGPLVRIKDRVDGEYYFRLIKENFKTQDFAMVRLFGSRMEQGRIDMPVSKIELMGNTILDL